MSRAEHFEVLGPALGKGHDKYCQSPYEECNQTDNSKADHSNLTPQFLPFSGLTFWSVAYSEFSSEPVV